MSDHHPVDDVTSDAFYESRETPGPETGGDSDAVALGTDRDLGARVPGSHTPDEFDAGDVDSDLDPADLEPWIAPDDIPAVRGALLRYRVMAYVVGTLLVVLVCIAMPLKYFADMPQMVSVVGVAHGWLYALLLITAYMLGRKAGWPLWRLVIIALAGTVPFLSFVAEHYARTDVNRRIAETEAYYRNEPETESEL